MSNTLKPSSMEQTSADVATHVYQREIHAQSNDSLSKIVALIPPGSTVLDVGTGSGALGRYLNSAGGFTVDGLTYNAEEAALAQPHYRLVQTLDLEKESLLQAVGESRYDVVVCADVLEHLRNAGSVLQAMAALLKPGGRVLISLPNVTHMGVLLELMAGRFVRTQEGLLDSTHVHFMDRAGLNTLVEQAGFSVVSEDAVTRNLVQTEFAALNFQVLPKAVRNFVAALPDSHIYQFVWALQPKLVSGVKDIPITKLHPPAVPVVEQVPYFRTQLFLDRGDGFVEKDCIDAFGSQTNALQTLRFKLTTGSAIRAIRVDLADRPGQMEFVHLAALDVAGTVIWKWHGDWAANLVYHQTDWTGARGWLGGRVVRLTGDDPWVQIPLSAEAWRNAAEVEMCISSPQPLGGAESPGVDAAQIQSALQLLSQQAAVRLGQLEQQLDSARSLADFRQSDIDTLRRELQAMTGLADFRQSDIDTLRRELQAMTGLADFRQSDIDTLRHELQVMTETNTSTNSALEEMRESKENLNAAYQRSVAESERLRSLAVQLDTVLNSWSWRMTKGPRWLARKLKQIFANQHDE
jgi:2-polyprenyl-3-methyl-5-hydroxy-6-metoxy-1,4-benzoquinol methylase